MFSGVWKLVRLKFVSSFEFSTNVARKGGPFRRKTFARLRKHGFLSAGPLCHMRHPSLGSHNKPFGGLQTFVLAAQQQMSCHGKRLLMLEKQTAACIPTEHPLAALARKNAGESAVPPWVVQLWAIWRKPSVRASTVRKMSPRNIPDSWSLNLPLTAIEHRGTVIKQKTWSLWLVVPATPRIFNGCQWVENLPGKMENGIRIWSHQATSSMGKSSWHHQPDQIKSIACHASVSSPPNGFWYETLPCFKVRFISARSSSRSLLSPQSLSLSSTLKRRWRSNLRCIRHQPQWCMWKENREE